MPDCKCDRFEYLAGAATKVYAADFLERTGCDEETGEVFYRCRVCGTSWKRVERKDRKSPSLIKLPSQADV